MNPVIRDTIRKCEGGIRKEEVVRFAQSPCEMLEVLPPSRMILHSSFFILHFQALHDVTPNVVAIAVIIERMSCKISFQVSFFMII